MIERYARFDSDRQKIIVRPAWPFVRLRFIEIAVTSRRNDVAAQIDGGRVGRIGASGALVIFARARDVTLLAFEVVAAAGTRAPLV